MQINSNSYSVSEILDMLERRELLVNSEYQRGSGLWPNGPSSYFIDTILEGFPFPKIYLYEYLTRPDRRLRKEIVDGQQRVNAIVRSRRIPKLKSRMSLVNSHRKQMWGKLKQSRAPIRSPHGATSPRST